MIKRLLDYIRTPRSQDDIDRQELAQVAYAIFEKYPNVLSVRSIHPAKQSYCFSTDGENYMGEYETLEAMAIDYRQCDAEEIHIGHSVHDVEWYITTDGIIEDALCQLYDTVGEAAEDQEPCRAVIDKYVALMLKELPKPQVWRVVECSEEDKKKFEKLMEAEGL